MIRAVDDVPSDPVDKANDSHAVYNTIIRSRRLRAAFGRWRYHVTESASDSKYHVIRIRRFIFGLPTPLVDRYLSLQPTFNAMQGSLIDAIRHRRPFTFGQLLKAMRARKQ